MVATSRGVPDNGWPRSFASSAPLVDPSIGKAASRTPSSGSTSGASRRTRREERVAHRLVALREQDVHALVGDPCSVDAPQEGTHLKHLLVGRRLTAWNAYHDERSLVPPAAVELAAELVPRIRAVERHERRRYARAAIASQQRPESSAESLLWLFRRHGLRPSWRDLIWCAGDICDIGALNRAFEGAIRLPWRRSIEFIECVSHRPTSFSSLPVRPGREPGPPLRCLGVETGWSLEWRNECNGTPDMCRGSQPPEQRRRDQTEQRRSERETAEGNAAARRGACSAVCCRRSRRLSRKLERRIGGCGKRHRLACPRPEEHISERA